MVFIHNYFLLQEEIKFTRLFVKEVELVSNLCPHEIFDTILAYFILSSIT